MAHKISIKNDFSTKGAEDLFLSENRADLHLVFKENKIKSGFHAIHSFLKTQTESFAINSNRNRRT